MDEPRKDVLGPTFRCGTPQSVFYSRLQVIAKTRRRHNRYFKTGPQLEKKAQQRKRVELNVSIALLKAQLKALGMEV